jgi:hypothetical protein
MNTTTSTVPATLTIGHLSFTVELIDATADNGRPCYRLTGKRGAKYQTMRNVRHGHMYIVHAFDSRSFGMVSGLERTILSDDGGTLRVVS